MAASHTPAVASYESPSEPPRFSDPPLSLIDPDPNKPRSQCQAGKIEVMRQSLLAIGQQQPVIVELSHVADRFRLVHGHIRCEARRAAGWTTIKAIVLPGSLGPAERLARQLGENDIRCSLSPIDQGRPYQRLLLLEGISQTALSQRYGFQECDISRALALVHKLPEFFQQRVAVGTVPEGSAYLITTVKNEVNRAKLAQRFLSAPMTMDRLARAIALLNGQTQAGTYDAPLPSYCTVFSRLWDRRCPIRTWYQGVFPRIHGCIARNCGQAGPQRVSERPATGRPGGPVQETPFLQALAPLFATAYLYVCTHRESSVCKMTRKLLMNATSKSPLKPSWTTEKPLTLTTASYLVLLEDRSWSNSMFSQMNKKGGS